MPVLVFPKGSSQIDRCVKGHRDLRHFKDGALWVCSGCGKRDQWSDSWGYMGNLECVKCARQAIEFVACSETCRTLLERPSLPSRGRSRTSSAGRKVRRA